MKLQMKLTPQQKHNRALLRKYPFLRTVDKEDANANPYLYTALDWMPEGWRNAFGLQMCQDLKVILKKAHCLHKFRFTDIKEKWGILRISYNSYPQKIETDLTNWEIYYEDLSQLTCIECGSPTAYKTSGWINYLCPDCGEKVSPNLQKLTKKDIPVRYNYDRLNRPYAIASPLQEYFKYFWEEDNKDENTSKTQV